MNTLLCIVTIFLITSPGYSQVIEEWVTNYNGNANESDAARAMDIDSEGNIYITGTSRNVGTGLDIATLKYNAEGVEQWVQIYDGPENLSDRGISIHVDNTGNVYVLGKIYYQSTSNNLVLIKYSSSGDILWDQVIPGGRVETYYFEPTNLISSDAFGNVYITCCQNSDFLTSKYNLSGDMQWTVLFDGPGNLEDIPYAIAVDDSGQVYVTGRVFGGGETQTDYCTIKYSTEGNEEWVNYYDGTAEPPDVCIDIATCIDLDTQGNVFVSGFSDGGSVGSGTNLDIVTIKYSSSGNEEWQQRFDINAGSQYAFGLAVDGMENVSVTGTTKISGGGENDDILTLRYNNSGLLQYSAVYAGTGELTDRPTSITVDNSGNTYVTGYTTNISNIWDWLTIKYDISGGTVWSVFYDGPGNDFDRPYDVEVDDVGNVYVTGSAGNGSSPDYTTIKYSENDLIVAWKNPAGGIFGIGSNWVGSNPPNDEQVALFDTSNFEILSSKLIPLNYQPLTITFDEITTTKGLKVSKSQIIFDLLQHSYGVNNLSVGGPALDPSESQLEIINGAIGTTNTLSIAENGYQGQLIIGSEGILEFNPQTLGETLQIGIGGGCPDGECGRLLIQDGGILKSNSSSFGSSGIGINGGGGAVFISGEDSYWEDNTTVVIGENGGTGLLNINNEGQLYGKSIWLAFLDDSNGEFIVTDSGSAIILDEKMFVGIGSNTEAHFTVSNGGTAILNKGIEIGGGSGDNDVTVKGVFSFGEPSTLVITDTTFIGTYGSGGMTVLNWGYLLTSTAVIPREQGGIGSALVDGEGSEWRNAGTIRLGFEGVGFINVTNQGVLYTAKLQTGSLGSVTGNNIYIGNLPPDSQRKTKLTDKIEEAYLLANASIYVDTLLLSEDAELIADSVIFGEGGYLGCEGSFAFDVVNSGGINPGDSINTPGIFTIDANYTQLSNGTLFIELGGDSPGTGFDKLIVTGDATIAGTLDVSALNLFEPQVGQTFEILTANNITGTFDDIVAHRGLEVDVTYNSTNILITVTSPVSVENNSDIIPSEYSLEQNYPNPFNPSTTISFLIPEASFVSLKIFNTLGEEVETLVTKELSVGNYTYDWKATGLTSGIYFYKLQAGNFTETKKMILLK